jgi:hypothetical protein
MAQVAVKNYGAATPKYKVKSLYCIGNHTRTPGEQGYWSMSFEVNYERGQQESIFWSEIDIYFHLPSENDIFPLSRQALFQLLLCPICLKSSLLCTYFTLLFLIFIFLSPIWQVSGWQRKEGKC